jgi:SPX domain protein involved in polyphosphate accumulation
MKFGAQLKADAIPEWKSAYLDYKGLKKRIGRIELDRQVAFTSTIVPMSPEKDTEKTPISMEMLGKNLSSGQPQNPFLDSELQKVEESENVFEMDSAISDDRSEDSFLSVSEENFFCKLDSEIYKVEEFCRTNILNSTDRLVRIQVRYKFSRFRATLMNI